MSDQPHNPANDNDRTLREISHLFLSSVRDKQTGGATRPQRTPPQQPPQPRQQSAPGAMDMSHEEITRALEASDAHPEERTRPVPAAPRSFDDDIEPAAPVSIVMAPHLNGSQRQRVREYAAHLCKTGERIGLIEIDAAEFRLSCFELGSDEPVTESNVCDQLDARRMAEALEEMSWDVNRWVLNLANPRQPEARALLRAVRNWTVLATCDHDGVVACYRTLKGLADLHEHELHQDDAPTLSLALLGCGDELQSMRVFRKLSNVCQQFLHWPLESEPPVVAAGSVVEHAVLVCRSTRDKAQLAAAPQWQIVAEFLTRALRSRNERTASGAQPARLAPGIPISADSEAAERAHAALPRENNMSFDQVIDLPAGADSSAAIVSATLHGESSLVECPVKPPMLPDAILAVARDRRLILLAVARQGLSDLRAIGEAWRWMTENRQLISMAVPQLAIDPHQLPHLRLLVDRADLSASTLQPLLQSGNVTVHTYRKLRWGEKTGLLLEAA